MLWHADSLGEFYDCNEDTTVYFHPASGNTHLLSNFAAYLLQQLAQQQPLGLDQLITKISPDIDSQDLPELSRALPEILGELVALDVIEPL